MRSQFRVWPLEHKVRYYYNLYDISNDFSRDQLEGATIAFIFNGVVAGYLNTETVLKEVYHEI